MHVLFDTLKDTRKGYLQLFYVIQKKELARENIALQKSARRDQWPGLFGVV